MCEVARVRAASYGREWVAPGSPLPDLRTGRKDETNVNKGGPPATMVADPAFGNLARSGIQKWGCTGNALDEMTQIQEHWITITMH
jgi:hypothetical protein